MKSSQILLKALSLVLLLVFAYWCEKPMGAQVKPEAVPQSSSGEPRLVVQLGHAGAVTAVAFSSDGRLVVTSGIDQAVILWDAATGREIRRFAIEDNIESVAFAQNSYIVLTKGEKATLTLWSAETAKVIATFGSADTAVSSDGRLLLTDRSSAPTLYNALTGEQVHRYNKPGDVKASSFSPDGRFVLIQKKDKTAALWNTRTGEEERRFDGEAAKFSPDGRFVVTRMEEIVLWNAGTGELIRRFAGGHAEVSPDGRSVITSIGEEARFGNKPKNTNPSEIMGASILFESSTGKELRRFTGNAATFSPDSRLIVTTGSEGPILWDAVTGQMLKSFDNKIDTVDIKSGIKFSADGQYFITVGNRASNDMVSLWDARVFRKIREFYPPKIASIAFSPDSRYLLTGDVDKRARLWELATGLEARRFEGLTSSIGAVRFTNDGQFIEMKSFVKSREAENSHQQVLRNLSFSAYEWEVATGQQRRSLEGLSEAVYSATVSSDGRFVVTGGRQSARLWEVSSNRVIRDFEGHTGLILSTSFSHDDRLLLTASADGTARLWEVASGREVRRFVGHSDEVWHAVLSHDGHFVLTASFKDRSVRLWDAMTGRELRQFGKASEGSLSFPLGAALSPDGRSVLAGVLEFSDVDSGEMKITSSARLWDATTGREVRRFEHPSVVTSVAFSPDGRRILTGCGDMQARLWDASSGKLIRSFQTPNILAMLVAFSSDGRYILANGAEALSSNTQGLRACLWDANTGRVVKRFVSEATDTLRPVFYPIAIAFSADSRFVVTVSERLDSTESTSAIGDIKSIMKQRLEEGEDETPASAQLWDVATGKQVRSFGRDNNGPQGIEFSPNGETALVRNHNFGAVQLLDADTGLELRRFIGPTKEVTDLAYSPDGRLVVASSEDGATYLWETETGKLLHRFVEFSSDAGGWEKEITGLTFLAENSGVGFIVGEKDVIIADALTGTTVEKVRTVSLEELEADNKIPNLTCLAISPDKIYLAVGDDEGNIKLFDARAGGRHLLEGAKGSVASIKFSPDNRLVASLSDDGGVVLWDLETFKKIDGLWLEEAVKNIEFAPTGNLLLTSGGKTTRLWNVKTRSIVRQLKQDEPVTATAFSSDGSLIAIGSEGGTVMLWQASTGAPIRTLHGHTAKVMALAFTPDSSLVVSASEDNTVRSWKVTNGVQSSSMSVQREEGEPLVLSSDGRMAVTADADKMVRLWNVVDSKEVGKIRSRFHSVNSVTFSPDGRFVLTGSTEWKFQQGQDNVVDEEPVGTNTRLWDVTTGMAVHTYTSEGLTSYVSFSPDGKYVLSKISPGISFPIIEKVVVWETETARKLREFKFKEDGWATSVAMSADARQLLAGSGFSDSPNEGDKSSGDFDKNNAAWLLDAETRKVIHALTGHSSPVMSVAMSPNDKYILTGSADGTTAFWDAKTGKQLCRLISFRDGTWVVVDRDGRFDTNNLEMIRGAHWIMPDDPLTPLPMEIFMRQYYEPRLLARILGGDTNFERVSDLAKLNRVQPGVHISKVEPVKGSSDAVLVTVELSAAEKSFKSEGKEVVQKTGVYDLRLFRDGQLVGYEPRESADERERAPAGGSEELQAWRTKARIELDSAGKATKTFVVKLPHEDEDRRVEFSAYAFNADKVKSATDRLIYQLPEAATSATAQTRGRAYLITFGVNRFENQPTLTLMYAANDARLMRDILGASLESLKRYEEVVRIPLIKDLEERPEEVVIPPTRENLRTVLELLARGDAAPARLQQIPVTIRDKIKKAEPDDIVILTFSTHGEADAHGDFYLYPTDTGADISGPDLLRHSISSTDLSLWLRDVDAGEVVMILDACYSAAAPGANFKPGPMGSRGLGQLAYDKGMRILAATQADNIALGSGASMNGLLTTALLRYGIEGGGAAKNRRVTLKGWLEYGVKTVPLLFKKEGVEGKEQKPALFDFARKKPDIIVAELAK